MKIKDFEELFESFARALPAYPVTLVSVFVAPKRVLENPRGLFICSPAIVLFFGFMLGYFIVRYASGEMKRGPQMLSGPPVWWLVLSAVFTVLMIALQRIFVRFLVRETGLATVAHSAAAPEESEFFRDLACFTYAWSAVVPIGASVWSFYRILPPDDEVLRTVLIVILYVSYAWSLFNMIRVRFCFTSGRALTGVLLALVAFAVAGGVVALLFTPLLRKV